MMLMMTMMMIREQPRPGPRWRRFKRGAGHTFVLRTAVVLVRSQRPGVPCHRETTDRSLLCHDRACRGRAVACGRWFHSGSWSWDTEIVDKSGDV